MSKNEELIRIYVIKNNLMTEEEYDNYIKLFDYPKFNTKSGWRKKGFWVMQSFERIIPIPDELGTAGAQRALNKYDMNSSDSRAERDYVSEIRKERAERYESAEFPVCEIPLWRKVEKEIPLFNDDGSKVMEVIDGIAGQKVEYKEVWELVPTAVYTRRQVEPSKRRLAQPMFKK